MVNAELD